MTPLSTFQHKWQAYSDSVKALSILAAGIEIPESLTHRIDLIRTTTKEFLETGFRCPDYENRRDRFSQFTEEQLNFQLAALSIHEKGREVIKKTFPVNNGTGNRIATPLFSTIQTLPALIQKVDEQLRVFEDLLTAALQVEETESLIWFSKNFICEIVQL